MSEHENSFDSFKLDPRIHSALTAMGFTAPTDVQSETYAIAREGKDLIVQSHTGSGKTAAFGVPTIQRLLDTDQTGTTVLILAPTRELAKQVNVELERIVANTDLTTHAVYGGAAIGPQIKALEEGVNIISGTPGRVLDHIRRKTLKVSELKVLILDECDEMLSMGFQDELDEIFAKLPKAGQRQTLLFSATVPAAIRRIATTEMQDPTQISMGEGSVDVAEIEHRYYITNGVQKLKQLWAVLLQEKPEHTIIFCNTRDSVNTVSKYLRRQGFDAAALSGEMSQKDREKSMSRMRNRELQYLVATDVAARGIDINDLSHVINYEFPDSPESYVHRSGRTGRAGKKGISISFIGPREIGSFYKLKKIYDIIPTEHELPDTDKLEKTIATETLTKVVAWAKACTPSQNHQAAATELLQHKRALSALTALLAKTNVGKNHSTTSETKSETLEPSAIVETVIKWSGSIVAKPSFRDVAAQLMADSSNAQTTTAALLAQAEATGVTTAQESSESRRKPKPKSKERSGKSKKHSAPAPNGPTRLFINIGSSTVSDPKEILAALFGENVPDPEPRVLLRKTHSYVRVSAAAASALLKREDISIGETQIKVEVAKR